MGRKVSCCLDVLVCWATKQTVMSEKIYHVKVTNVEDLTPPGSCTLSYHIKLYPSGDSNSCYRDQEIGALTKELASRLRTSKSLQASLQSFL
jgi:hypothetical protein